MKRCNLSIVLGVALVGWLTSTSAVFAQGTAFTYQGQLASNSVTLTGNYDMQFKLHPASTGTNQVGPTLTNSPTGVTNGLFVVTLNFTETPYNGQSLWLEIGVRPYGNTNAYVILSPTQEITSTPYAVMSLTAGTAASLTGGIIDSQLPTNVPLLGGTNIFTGPVTLSNGMGNFDGALSGTFNGTGSLNGTFTGTGAGTFNGNGGGLTNLNVTNLVGVVQANQNWQLVQSSSQQAVSANNYLTTNGALTTLILPPSPGVGDTFRFSGSGVGGWMIAQNSGQSILTTGLGLPAGKNWSLQSSSPSTPWRSLASSSNGINLVGAAYNGYLYTSTNAGQTWNQVGSSQPWYSVCSSSDGTHLAAAIDNGYIYTSTNSGSNWTQQTASTSEPWYSIASSSDGTKLAACVDNGYIYTSVNSGVAWTKQTGSGSQPWYSIASSADGTKLAACVDNGYIWTSVNSGVTWTQQTTSGSEPWYSIASSADGTELVAVANNSYIWTSGDSGANWAQQATSLSTQPWFSVASSGSGAALVAIAYNGLIYNSVNGGQTWTARTSGNQSWQAVCISGDGTRAAAGISTGQIYTSTSATTVGTSGYLMGAQYSNIELQSIGNGQWMPLTFAGSFTAN